MRNDDNTAKMADPTTTAAQQAPLPTKQPAIRVECISCGGEISGPQARAYLRGTTACPFCHTSLDDAPDPDPAGPSPVDSTYLELVRKLPPGYTVERDGLRWYPMRNGRVIQSAYRSGVYYGTFADAVAYCQRDDAIMRALLAGEIAEHIQPYRDQQGMSTTEALDAWARDEINRMRLNELRIHAGLPPNLSSSADRDTATPATPAPGAETGTETGQE